MFVAGPGSAPAAAAGPAFDGPHSDNCGAACRACEEATGGNASVIVGLFHFGITKERPGLCDAAATLLYASSKSVDLKILGATRIFFREVRDRAPEI